MPKAKHKHEWIPIVYGLPGGDLWEAADRGEVSLGGCLISPGNPTEECVLCGKRRGKLKF